MGFMDKAKKLAEQAQEKLDETQKNFNQGQGQGQTGGQPAVRYDQHGRPIQDAPPAGETAPPSGQPAAPAAPEDEVAPGAPGAPPASPQVAPTPPPDTGSSNSTPDPFKPIGG